MNVNQVAEATRALSSLAALEQYRARLVLARDDRKPCVTVCGGTGCRAYGSEDVLKAAQEAVGAEAGVRMTGCHGFCEKGPLVVVQPQGTFYARVKPEDMAEVVDQTLRQGRTVQRLLYTDPATGQQITHEHDVPFYAKQMRVLLNENGLLDPTSIDEYIALGGYAALARALGMQGDQIIDEVLRAGLRGRGGGGFPTGKKWSMGRANMQKAGSGHVICNADEGDPGAYMDRSLMEGNPHRVIEGMLIGARAMGATSGYVYIRAEYPLAVKHLGMALEQARRLGLLGDNILGTGWSFDITVGLGAGAFVCGEETALMASLEGRIGEPRPRPPYPTDSGLWDLPTVINNVKSWASVPIILSKGAEWYRAIGTENSKGTMIFSLVGKVANTGLVEVPMGITLRELIFGIGGGVPNGKAFKAAQIGGPSGGCIPAEHLDTPIDYESLNNLGAIMGSGGLVVVDEDTCMVDLARYFLEFTRFESCGKCTACREGIRQMYNILDRISKGQGRTGDIERLESLGQAVKDASLCGLGRSAPNPVLTMIRYFRDEYDAHIQDARCPAGVCKGLISFVIVPEKCPGCGVCLRNCSEGAITGEKARPHTIDPDRCIRCGVCRDVCKFNAVLVRQG